jgi:ubiquinone/menaquinone biosynthesis C-methylase UbiE
MRRHPVFARVYGRLAPGSDASGTAAHRDELLAGLEGQVIEVGAGSGLSFSHYPASVEGVLAVEPEPYLRRLARDAATTAPVPVRVVEGTAEDLPAVDGSFDAAVVSLVLCSVPDQRTALRELHRVLREGGWLHFYEHVRSGQPGSARLQDRVDRVWPLFAGGCHSGRDTAGSIEEAGFRLERCRRFEYRKGSCFGIVSPHVIGRAVRV